MSVQQFPKVQLMRLPNQTRLFLVHTRHGLTEYCSLELEQRIYEPLATIIYIPSSFPLSTTQSLLSFYSFITCSLLCCLLVSSLLLSSKSLVTDGSIHQKLPSKWPQNSNPHCGFHLFLLLHNSTFQIR